MRKVRWGILSTANIGRKRVVPAMQLASNGVVTAVASRDQSKAQAFADELGIPKAYGSYEELIADPDIDAIYNPLPNSLHHEWSVKCAEAGKPTLCEKPLASNAGEAQAIVDAFASRGVLFAEAFMWRFHPQSVRVKALIDSGAIGTLRMLTAAFSFSISNEDDIRLSHELAGGSLMDVGCYCINAMRLMTGEEPHSVRAFGRIGARSQVDETLTGILEFPGGALGHFDCSLRAQHRHMIEIRGTEGRIAVDESFVMPPDRATTIRMWQSAGGGTDVYTEITVPPANSYTIMAEDFADALLNNRPPRYAPQDAVSNMKVIDALLASLPQG